VAPDRTFQHLTLLLRYQGRARLTGGGRQSPETLANKNARKAHSDYLHDAAQSLSDSWRKRKEQRKDDFIPKGIPILLKVDPGLELNALREKFAFEIVAEQEEGYVIVASEDLDLTLFLKMVDEFSVEIHGSATIASVHKLLDDPAQVDRLQRILSPTLMAEWPLIKDEQLYIIDVGIACLGTEEIPEPPKRGKTDLDSDWARKERVKMEREDEVTRFVDSYGADIIHIIDGQPFDASLQDSFTIRLRIVGVGLKDLALNYPYIFEVLEPDDIELPQRQPTERGGPEGLPPRSEPEVDSPAVCVIDSGIQEAHVLIQPAIDSATSHCFLPDKPSNDVGDFVAPGGHGTRVAGAVLYGETIDENGPSQLPFWIQNARVVDHNNKMPVSLFPPQVLRAAIERFHEGPRRTRIFNHSINAISFCRTRYMSSWAAEIDFLSAKYDVLVVQSAGNLPISGANPYLGVADHLAAGRSYPKYLYEHSSRVANPAQSLQALTVGSVGYGLFEDGPWRTFALEQGYPSAFSRSGFGIWGTIKPEVVEYGGDDVHTNNEPPEVQGGGRIGPACPLLVRSTIFPPGPAFDRDESGTSFAAPKVARIAARLQALLPDEPAILYRALVVQSARWPTWGERLLEKLRDRYDPPDAEQRDKLLGQVSRLIRCIGYGIPDEARATTNSDYRTTFITSGDNLIRAGECHFYQVRIPPDLRQQADEFDIRIDVTLSYVAEPRRTRRNPRRYLSTWVDWKSSKLGESINTFRLRAMREEESEMEPLPGQSFGGSFMRRPTGGS